MPMDWLNVEPGSIRAKNEFPNENPRILGTERFWPKSGYSVGNCTEVQTV